MLLRFSFPDFCQNDELEAALPGRALNARILAAQIRWEYEHGRQF